MPMSSQTVARFDKPRASNGDTMLAVTSVHRRAPRKRRTPPSLRSRTRMTRALAPPTARCPAQASTSVRPTPLALPFGNHVEREDLAHGRVFGLPVGAAVGEANDPVAALGLGDERGTPARFSLSRTSAQKRRVADVGHAVEIVVRQNATVGRAPANDMDVANTGGIIEIGDAHEVRRPTRSSALPWRAPSR